MQQPKQPVGILLISTGQYKQFVFPLLASLQKHFLADHLLNIYLFTDEFNLDIYDTHRLNIHQYQIPSYKFPEATLYRYKIFTSRQYPECSHLFYFDVDMKIVADIGEEFLGNIVAVRHPGFDKMGGGSWETRPESTSFTTNRAAYYAGGVQGGKTEFYYPAMVKMRDMIQIDEGNGFLPVWHDESAWNFIISTTLLWVNKLDSSYCMVEQMDLRRKWKIDHLEPKVIALEKDHQKIRE